MDRVHEAIHVRPSNSCTCTGSPGLDRPRSCSSTMKQFASDIERSTPEPCWPVGRTLHSPSVAVEDAALVLGAPGLFAHRGCAGAPAAAAAQCRRAPGQVQQRARARTGRRSPSPRPDCRAGRRGTPFGRIRPKAIGRPGRMAIFQNTTSPSLRHHLLDEIGFADGNAARGDHRVGARRGLAERGFQLRRVVAHHAQVDDLARPGAAACRTACSGWSRRPRLPSASCRSRPARRRWRRTRRAACAARRPRRCRARRSVRARPGAAAARA